MTLTPCRYWTSNRTVLNVDIAADGSIYGLELLNANKQLGIRRAKKFIVENGVSGESLELAVG